jgi:branched-chain amino acid transport system ATP-binding protein
MLTLRALEAGYGTAQVLFGIDLDVKAGEAVTLIGRNGMGKTTTIRTIMGLVRARAGSVTFKERDLTGQPAHIIAQRGIGLVPEGRQIFIRLSVEENLIATAANRGVNKQIAPWTLPRVFDLFPRLEERRRQSAATLSGGEQQMLAIGRALMTNPALLILDEATEGLAPLIRKDIWACLAKLKSEGLSILVVDRNLDEMMRLADRHNVVEKGRVVWSGSSVELAQDRHVIEQRIGV